MAGKGRDSFGLGNKVNIAKLVELESEDIADLKMAAAAATGMKSVFGQTIDLAQILAEDNQ